MTMIHPSTNTYPITRTWLQARHPGISLPQDLSALFSDPTFGLFPVQTTTPPVAEDGFNVIEGHPELVDEEWFQTWESVPIEVIVPSPIRMEQFWLGLYAISPELFTAADHAVESNPVLRRACSAPTIRRESVMLEQMRVALNVEHELLDQVFRAGVSIET